MVIQEMEGTCRQGNQMAGEGGLEGMVLGSPVATVWLGTGKWINKLSICFNQQSLHLISAHTVIISSVLRWIIYYLFAQ